MSSSLRIRRAQPCDAEKFFEHLVLHMDESGNGDLIFQPTQAHKAWKKSDLVEKTQDQWTTSLTQINWGAAWILEDEKHIYGHVDLCSSPLESSLHRAMLGMGLMRDVRGKGFGRKLAQTAIDWARSQPSVDWIDLRVFAHNHPARNLYRSLGFIESGVVEDLFRVNGQSIDDIRMVLDVRSR